MAERSDAVLSQIAKVMNVAQTARVPVVATVDRLYTVFLPVGAGV